MDKLTWEILMPNNSSEHLDDEEIEQYSWGKASKAQEDAWEDHLLICGSCRDRVETVDTFLRAMKSAAADRRLAVSESKQGRWNRFFPAMAALAAAALILVAWANWGKINGSNAAPATVLLRAMRGPDASGAAPAGRPLSLLLDVTELAGASEYRAEIVAGAGNRVWSGTAAVRGSQAVAEAPAEKAGTYYVRIYSGAGELLREYALKVESR